MRAIETEVQGSGVKAKAIAAHALAAIARQHELAPKLAQATEARLELVCARPPALPLGP